MLLINEINNSLAYYLLYSNGVLFKIYYVIITKQSGYSITIFLVSKKFLIVFVDFFVILS